MKLSCPSCAAKYSIADEKVYDRLAKIRCRKCSATIIVDGKVNPPNVYTSDGGAAPEADAGESPAGEASGGEYSVDFGDNDQRPMSADDIIRACRRGEMTPDMFVWAEGMADWQAVSEVPELAAALGGGGSGASRIAARSGAGRGSAHDLFGGIERAGSEDDVMTSAPHQAQAPAAGVATGARNESSVLFSLSALTASAPAAAPTKSATSAPSALGSSASRAEDSGIIDLKALTSTVGSQPPPGPFGSAPLGMASPLGGITAPAMSVDGPAQRPAGNKTGLYIGGALIMVGALIAGAIVMTSNKGAPAAPASPVAAIPAAATPEPKKEEPTAAPPSTGTATAEAAPSASAAAPTKTASATKTASHHYRSAKATSKSASSSAKSSSGSSDSSDSFLKSDNSGSSAKASSSDSSGSSEKPKKKKKEKACNCSPGDLMCAMKCAAG